MSTTVEVPDGTGVLWTQWIEQPNGQTTVTVSALPAAWPLTRVLRCHRQTSPDPALWLKRVMADGR